MTKFSRVVREAIRYFLANGYSSSEEMNEWASRIRMAAYEVSGTPDDYMSMITSNLSGIYDLQVNRGKALKRHEGISRLTLESLNETMRAELDRRIMASADLIKINRTKAVETTISRFVGWSTSIPAAEHDIQQGRNSARGTVAENARHIEKSAKQVDFEARRVMIDQGHKLISNIDNIVATNQGAIAAVWHSNWKRPGYNFRKDHKDRDLKAYLIRDNWAQKNGYAKAGPAGYLDEVTQPGEEVFCSCYVTYIYNIRSLPADMLTKKGTDFMAKMRSGTRG